MSVKLKKYSLYNRNLFSDDKAVKNSSADSAIAAEKAVPSLFKRSQPVWDNAQA